MLKRKKKKKTVSKKSKNPTNKSRSTSKYSNRSDEEESKSESSHNGETSSNLSYEEDENEDDEDDDEEYNDDDDDDEDDDDDDDDDEYDYFKYRRRQSTRAKKKKGNRKKTAKITRAATTRTNRATAIAINQRKSSASRATASKKINYCEESDDDEYSDNDDEYNIKNAKKNNSRGPSNNKMETDDSNVETIEKVIRTRTGKVGATGSKTALYNVEEHGDPNIQLVTDEVEPQYLIKWQNWSHIHNTWESRESLIAQRVRGLKKLDNYLARTAFATAAAISQSPEDVEYLACQAELYDSLIDTHALCERIIAIQGSDYLCKWQGLPYSECTWEDGELIKRRFPEQVEEFERRQKAQTYPPVSVKSQRVVRIRPRFLALKEKPDYLGNTLGLDLRDYQLDGLNWLANSWCRQNGIILADEMGLGKTIQAISFLSYVFNEHNLYGPFLIVLPLSTIQQWQRELQRWSPEINVVIYLGDGNSRSMIQQYEWYSENKKIKCNAILTTYEILLKDKAFFNNVSWAVLIVDEAHRLKNEDSLLYQTLIKFDTNHRLLITGTPLQNSLKELWSLLHFIMPEKFDSWEEFDNKYTSVLSDGLRFQDLHKELQPYLLRRVKKDVEKSLPAKVEQILRVEMTKTQKQYYKLILTKNFKELCKGPKGSYSSFLNIMMELKKCSNHVYLIRRDESENLEQLIKGSGKLLLLDKLLRRLKETGHRVLIFSQMVRMLDLLAEYLQYRRFPFQRLDGSIKGEVRKQALDHFNSEQSEDFCFLLSTRAGGLGINLSTADTVIIYDSDWNPQNDLQAQARAHRIGQKNQVNIYRLVSKNSIEEDIIERAKQKMVLDHLVIQRMDTTGRTVLEKTSMVGGGSTMPFSKEDINSILKFGAEELFKEKENEEDPNEREELQAYDIDEILKRAETREETHNHLTPGEELLSQFKVANFSTMEDDPILPNNASSFSGINNENASSTHQTSERTWSEIIPESERKQLEIEEESEKLKILCVDTSRRNKKQQSATVSAEAETVTTSSSKSKTAKSKTKRNRKSRTCGSTAKGKHTSSSEDQESFDDSGDENDENNNDDDDVDGDASSVGEYRKQRGGKVRGGGSHDHSFKGLNAQEIRRFVRSYRKFPCPLAKIDVIAQDAHLEEKSQACLIDFAKKMYSACKSALDECEASGKQIEDELNEKEKSSKSSGSTAMATNKLRGPVISFNGVLLYPQQILDAEQYFAPLVHFITSITAGEFSFKTKLKQTYWQCEWSERDDMFLLRGIYEHGYGNWEWIKGDAALDLSHKILMCESSEKAEQETSRTAAAITSNEKKKKLTKVMLKPQSKHLRTRIDYLIKVLQNQIDIEQFGPDWKKRKETNASTSSINKQSRKKNDPTIEDEINGSEANKRNRKRTSSKLKRKHKKNSTGDCDDNVNPSVNDNSNTDGDSIEEKTNNHESNESSIVARKKARTNSATNVEELAKCHHSSSMNYHRTMNEEASSDLEQHSSASNKKPQHNKSKGVAPATSSKDLSNNSNNKKEKKIILNEKIFNECKSILRPVKNALKNIDPQESLNEREHIEKIKRHILEIGDKINDHLTVYSDPEKIKEWRNYLWVFVSKFTSKWSWQRIKDMYKKFSMSRDNEQLLYGGGDGNKPSPSSNQSASALKNSGKQQRSWSFQQSYQHGDRQSRSIQGTPSFGGDRRDNHFSDYDKYKKNDRSYHSEYGSSSRNERDNRSGSGFYHHHNHLQQHQHRNYPPPPPLSQHRHSSMRQQQNKASTSDFYHQEQGPTNSSNVNRNNYPSSTTPPSSFYNNKFSSTGSDSGGGGSRSKFSSLAYDNSFHHHSLQPTHSPTSSASHFSQLSSSSNSSVQSHDTYTQQTTIYSGYYDRKPALPPPPGNQHYYHHHKNNNNNPSST